jgi:hypothetical protein
MGTNFRGQAVRKACTWTAWPLKVVPIVSPETSLANNQSTLRKILEGRRPDLQHGASPESQNFYFLKEESAWRSKLCTVTVIYKGKGRPRTGHKGPEGEKRYSFTLSLTSTPDGIGGQSHAPAALPPEKRPGNHCIGVWVGPRAGLDGCGKSRPHRDSIPRTFSP